MKQEKWFVYKHIAPNGKVYIGITHRQPHYRWGKNGNGYKSNHHFFNAIQKYGWDNIEHVIVTDAPTQEDAERIERELILSLKSYDARYGYNKALGGHALSQDSRQKISRTRIERKIPPWTLGKHLSEETKRKIGKANTGNHFTMTEESRRKISEAKRGSKNPNYGKPMPEHVKHQLITINEKPVVKVTESSTETFKSAKEAGQVTGVASCNIIRVCRGQRKTAGGYIWKYA